MQGVPRCPETERHTARHAEGTSMVFVRLFSGHTRTSQKLYAPHNGTKNAAPRLSIRVPWGRQRYAAVPCSRRLRSHWPRCTAAVAVVALCVGGPTAFVHDGLFSESGAAGESVRFSHIFLSTHPSRTQGATALPGARAMHTRVCTRYMLTADCCVGS